MKVNIRKNGKYTITDVSNVEMDVLSIIIFTADSRCFRELNDEGEYDSNDDFVCRLTKSERRALANIAKII